MWPFKKKRDQEFLFISTVRHNIQIKRGNNKKQRHVPKELSVLRKHGTKRALSKNKKTPAHRICRKHEKIILKNFSDLCGHCVLLEPIYLVTYFASNKIYYKRERLIL